MDVPRSAAREAALVLYATNASSHADVRQLIDVKLQAVEICGLDAKKFRRLVSINGDQSGSDDSR
jgi:hypothetical protein